MIIRDPGATAYVNTQTAPARLAEPVEAAPALAQDREEGLAELMGPVLGAPGWPTLHETLTEISLCLTEILPSAESAGVVVLASESLAPRQGPTLDRAEVIGAAPAGGVVLRIESELGEGPVLTACRSRRMVTSEDLAVDERWPRFGSAVGHLQLVSAVAVPLTDVHGVPVGALSLYSHQPHAFDPAAVHLIAAIADVARNALRGAAMIENTRRVYAAMSQSREESRMVNQAVGVLISRNCSEEQARMRLSRMASRNGEGVMAAARSIVDEARTEARLSFIASRQPSHH